MLEKLKKEPRTVLAIANIVCFLLPWISIGSSASVGNYSEQATSGAINGFDLLNYSTIGGFLYLVPICIIALPYIKKLEKNQKYFYLGLPVFGIVMMFVVAMIVGSVGGSASVGVVDYSVSVNKKIGFWLSLLCNAGIVVWTLVRDFHVKTEEFDQLTSQVTSKAKDMASSLYVTCPHCGEKVTKGKRFCSHCGAEIITEEKVEIQPKKNICPHCGQENKEGMKFCGHCGQAMEIEEKKLECPACHKELEPGLKFCPYCGEKVKGDS